MIFDFKNLSAYGQALKTTSTDVGELSKLTSNLTLVQTANALATKGLTKDKMIEILTNKGLTQAEAEATAAKIASTSANGVATFSLKAYTVALWENIKAIGIWMLTNPVGMVVGIGTAIGVAVTAYNIFNQTIEEQKEKISKLNGEYENTVQELKTLGDEINTNNLRIQELIGKKFDGSLTLIEEDELKKLTLANKLLAEQKDAKEKLEKDQASELLKSNRKTFYNEFGSDTTASADYMDTIHPLHSLQNIDSDDITDKNLILSINALYEGINKTIESGDEEATKSLEAGQENLVKILQGRSGAMLTELLKYQDVLAKFMNPDGTFDDAQDKEMWDFIEDWKKEIYKLTNSSGEWNTIQIETVLNDTSLQSVQAEIRQSLTDGATITEEDIAKYDVLMEALKNANLILDEGETYASKYLQYMKDISTTQEDTASIPPIFDTKQFTLDEVLEDLETTHDMLDTLKTETEEMGSISIGTIRDIATKYPLLSDAVHDYLAGKIDEQDLIQELEKEYETDLENYELYMLQKKSLDEDFYDQIIADLSQDIIAKADKYGIELGSYSTYLEAKLAMDKEYASKKIELERANYNFEQQASLVESGAPATLATFKAWERKDKAEKELTDIEEVINAFDTSIDNNIPDFNTNLLHDSKDGKDKEFSEEYDWIAVAVENAERAVSKLDEKLSNTNGFQKRIDVLNELKTANQDLVDTTGDASEKYKKIWEKESGKIDPKYVQYITGDRENLKIQNFTSEEEYNQVMKAVEAYDTWLASLDEHQQALEKQKADERAINSILLEKEEIKLEIHNLDNQESMTSTERLDWLKKEQKLKYNILQQNLLLATSEKERLRLQKEYDEYLEQNDDKEYEIGKEERSNTVSYYDNNIKDVQNDIDLAETFGGQGTEEQYSQINDYLQEQMNVYLEDAKAAKEMRDGEDEGTPLWHKYNNELQDAEDNIHACTVAQLENNRAILLLPIKQIEDQNKELEKQLDYWNDYQSKVENAIGYANMLIQEQIDNLNDSKENITNYWDEQIKAIQDQKDALTESNDELKRQIDLENAKYNLEKAIRNKTTRVYRQGEGFVYEADQKAIIEAQNELDQQEYDNTINNFDKIIKTLSEQKEDAIKSIDNQIRSWEEYAEKIDKVSKSYENIIAMQDFFAVFGVDALNSVMSMDTSILDTFASKLNGAKNQVSTIEEKIKANELTIQAINDEADEYLLKNLDVKTAQENIKKIILDNEEELLAIQERTNKTKDLSDTWTKTANLVSASFLYMNEMNEKTRLEESDIFNERKKKLTEFKDAALDLYGSISNAVNNANNSFSTLENILLKAKSTYEDILEYQRKAEGKGLSSASIELPEMHSGGIVTPSSDDLPKNLMKLTETNLKPNETLAKLLAGEVVLNHSQMDNMFNNLSRAYSAITPLNKRESSPMEITIGDVNVYNPDNSDMIVNEIVKELPLKVIQKLHSK